MAGAHAKKTSQGFSSCYTLFIMSAPLTYLDKLAEGQRVLYISLLQNSICSLKALPKLRRARVVRTVHVLLVCCELHRWIDQPLGPSLELLYCTFPSQWLFGFVAERTWVVTLGSATPPCVLPSFPPSPPPVPIFLPRRWIEREQPVLSKHKDRSCQQVAMATASLSPTTSLLS